MVRFYGMQSIEMITSITFRFDIDTIKCIEVGVPKLINLARAKMDDISQLTLEI